MVKWFLFVLTRPLLRRSLAHGKLLLLLFFIVVRVGCALYNHLPSLLILPLCPVLPLESSSSEWTGYLRSPSSVSGPNSSGWTTLLGEPNTETESSSFSVNGPLQSLSGEASANQIQEISQIAEAKRRLHNLICAQFVHYCNRGLPQWQHYVSPETELCAQNILSSLEIPDSVSEYEEWHSHLIGNPSTLYPLFREYVV